MFEAPRILTFPRAELATARTIFDRESALLRAEFAYPKPEPPVLSTLASRLNQDFGIEKTPPRILLGDVDLAFSDEQRLQSIEWRTNPASWRQLRLTELPEDAQPVWISFDVPYGANRIYAVEVPPIASWDPGESRLAIRFGPASITADWLRLADSVAIGVTSEGRLAELRLDNLGMTTPEDI